jgi:hypothetical protein
MIQTWYEDALKYLRHVRIMYVLWIYMWCMREPWRHKHQWNVKPTSAFFQIARVGRCWKLLHRQYWSWLGCLEWGLCEVCDGLYTGYV